MLTKNILPKKQTMKNIVGQTPRGSNFFKRDHIINKIYRRLDAGNHLFLSAPRRAGKTSIMRYLEDYPRKGYAFIYINTEDIKEAEDFFRLVSEKLLHSKAVEKMTQIAENSKSIFKQFTENIAKIKVWNFEVEMNQAAAPKYKNEFETLLQKLDTEDFRIIIMLDEFPVTIENIRNTQGERDSYDFLLANRQIRQQANKGIQFIYTGSIGLPIIARRLNATATLNDLNVLEIPPLSQSEGALFSRLILGEYGVKCPDEVIAYLLEKLQWLMPFFIQLVIQILIDEYEEKGHTITQQTVDIAVEKTATHRSNLYFENYLTRLDKTLSQEEAKNAKLILKEIALQTLIPKKYFEKMPGSRSILEMLELDGYITESKEGYRFSSPILGAWWKKHVD